MTALPPLDDAQAMAVLADALSSQGHPRGELISLQLAREERPYERRLMSAEQRALAVGDRELLGPLRLARTLFDFRWERGFIVGARLRSLEQPVAAGRHERRTSRADAPRERLPRLVRELLSLESACVLRALRLELPWSLQGRRTLLSCVEEVAAERPTCLQHLTVAGLNEAYATPTRFEWQPPDDVVSFEVAWDQPVTVEADVRLADDLRRALS